MEGWFAERFAQGGRRKRQALKPCGRASNAHVDSACASPVATAALYSLFVESLCAIPELQPRTRALSASFHDGFRGHLEQARRAGELREGVDCTKMANVLVGMLRGLIIQSLLEGDAAGLATNRRRFMCFIEAGLRKNGAGARASGTRRRNG